LAAFVWDWVESLHLKNGCVPGPTPPKGISEQIAVDSAGSEEAIEWKRNYHTMLVAGTAARVLRRDWDIIDQRIANGHEELQTYVGPNVLLLLGEALVALSGYELSRGAELLKASLLAHGGRGPLFEPAIEFLSSQRNPDGTFGRWVDEERVFSAAGGNSVAFRRDILEPLSATCCDVLNAFRE